MNENLIAKFQDLKSKQNELLSEKMRCEAKIDQMNLEIKRIQDKYPDYNLTTKESVEQIISELTEKLNHDLCVIEEQYNKIKLV